MSADSHDQQEGFLGRWSRLKTDSREAPPVPVEPAPAKVDADAAPPELPPIEKLSIDSDFSGFFHPKVGEDVRRAALRKLFSDPHFNVMDGLDVYIDDYSKTEPIPAAMLASMRQAQRILDWASGKDEGEDGAAKPAETEDSPVPLAAPTSAPAAVEHAAPVSPVEASPEVGLPERTGSDPS